MLYHHVVGWVGCEVGCGRRKRESELKHRIPNKKKRRKLNDSCWEARERRWRKREREREGKLRNRRATGGLRRVEYAGR